VLTPVVLECFIILFGKFDPFHVIPITSPFERIEREEEKMYIPYG